VHRTSEHDPTAPDPAATTHDEIPTELPAPHLQHPHPLAALPYPFSPLAGQPQQPDGVLIQADVGWLSFRVGRATAAAATAADTATATDTAVTKTWSQNSACR
jgi:hypothetical protein